MDLAKKLIDAAAVAGADLVKFQTFNADRLATQQAKKAEYQNVTTGSAESQHQMLSRLELSLNMHHELIAYCATRNIGFFSTGFDIESVDFFNNISTSSNVANDTVIGHQPISIIENFENSTLELNSYAGQDEDSEDWSIDSLNTFLNSQNSLKLYGNTWKAQNIGPINVEENSVWQISSFCEDKGEIIGVAFQDSINTLFYSFYGSQELNIEEWITVYQGSQPENQWNIFKLPFDDD